jgi:putative NADPH-quinone reductase
LAGKTFADACAEVGCQVNLIFLRDYVVMPCVACGVCGHESSEFPADYPWRLCPMSAGDKSDELFRCLLSAPFVTICSPVYFYHLPAQLKALLDRCQLFYQAKERGKAFMQDIPKRNFYTILLGARAQGEELFTGGMLSLKYALSAINFEPKDPLLMHGLDHAGDLDVRTDLLRQIQDYARRAVREYGE